MPTRTAAQAVIHGLRAHDVETVFGIPGVHTLPLYDALRAEQGLRHILARHEQGAGFMAGGYARATGRTGVVFTITGPGVTNVATPMADAYADSVPLLVISTSLPRAATGRATGDLHELKDQLGVMESLAGWARAVASADEIPDALRDAFRALRAGRPRGAYLQIPLDLLQVEITASGPAPARVPPMPPEPEAISAAARLLRESRQPLIVAGAGVTAAGANAGLAQLAELLQAPVLLGAKSRDALPTDFPLALVTSRYALPSELVDFVAQADAVLVVGSKLGAERTDAGRLRFEAPVVQIDIDPAEIGRQWPARVGVAADARLAIQALIAALAAEPGERHSPGDRLAAVRAALRATIGRNFGPAIAYLDALRERLPRDGIVVADMTMLGYAAAEHLPVYAPRTFLHPAELCTIGCGLPLALGAKAALPGRAVVALCGDGGFLLNTGELATAVQERLGAVVIVFNDAAYTAVKGAQRRRFGGRYIATDLVAPDYVALARAFGVQGLRAASPAELGAALGRALTEAGPTLIEVPLPAREW